MVDDFRLMIVKTGALRAPQPNHGGGDGWEAGSAAIANRYGNPVTWLATFGEPGEQANLGCLVVGQWERNRPKPNGVKAIVMKEITRQKATPNPPRPSPYISVAWDASEAKFRESMNGLRSSYAQH
jgi:hypothetical protein